MQGQKSRNRAARLWTRLAERARRRRGVALIVVVLMLAALVMVAVPFLLSSAMERRESRLFNARTRARYAAEGALARALWCLTRTGEGVERAGYYGQPFDTPDWDTLDELDVGFIFSPPPLLKGQKKAPPWPLSLDRDSFYNPKGEIWTVTVEDEQGKININSATPALLGALMSCALLETPLGAADESVNVGDSYLFADDGDPDTISGFVRVGREVMAYRSKTDSTLDGLIRGCYGTEIEKHIAGELIYDARAWGVSSLRTMGAPGVGRLQNFSGVSGIRQVSKFSPVRLGGRNYSMAFSPSEYEAFERYLTAGSYRPKADGWVRREKVLDGSWTADRRVFRLRDNANYGPGTLLRFLDENGRVRAFGQVLKADEKPSRRNKDYQITLEYGVGFGHAGGSEVFVEAELPHAININTARRQVLAACMTGVALRGRKGLDYFQALNLANRLVSTVITSRKDFDDVLLAAIKAQEITADQRRALLENATVPGSTRLRLCTAPFCFRAYNLFTVEASAIINNPASGRPIASHSIRQLVQMPTASPGLFMVRSQKEFEEQMRAGFGRKVVTWPVAMVVENATPDTRIDENVGDVRLGTGKLDARSARVLPGTVVVDNCDSPTTRARLTPDGYSLGDASRLSYGGSTCFKRSGGSVTPGSVEMWVKAKSWNGSLFRSASSSRSTRNLIDVSYDARNGELVMELGDGTYEGRTVTYREPYELETGVWYHIKAIYKSTRMGGQAFLVDGGNIAPQEAGRYYPGTTLTEDLDDWSTKAVGEAREVTVDSTAGFPSRGAFVIGDEIFEYASKARGTFREVRRARRYTQAKNHARGDAVQIYGYSAAVGGGGVPRVSGRVADAIGSDPRTRINVPGSPGPPPVAGGIEDDDDEIKVDSTANFQDAGFIWIGRECIYYARKSATRFRDCERGQRGTIAAKHNDNATVRAASLRVTSLTGYPSSGHVQIDDAGNSSRVEWIYYAKKVTHDGKRYLVPAVHTDRNGRKYMGGWRRAYRTSGSSHSKGARVIPVFTLTGPKCGDQYSPQYEEVTITDNSGNSERARLKRVYEGTSFWRNQNTGAQGWTHTWRAAFDRFVSRSYSGSQCRLLKFPSGELALKLGSLRVGKGLRGEVDEIRVTSGHSVAGKVPAGVSLGTTDTGLEIQMPSTTAAGRVPRAGALMINNELIYYTGRSTASRTLPFTPRLPFRTPQPQYDTRGVTVVRLSGVRRAVLGSRSAAHTPWSPAVFLEALPVTDLTSGTADTHNSVSLRSTTGFESEGYALVGSELIGYSKKARGGLSGAYFRGSFGTDAQRHRAGTLVLPMPFRYWDRYLPESDRSELAYFQGSFTAAGTRWGRIGMVLARTAHVRVRLQVRFDGAPGWNTVPTNRKDGLYEFEGPGPHELVTAGGRAMRADQIEYRVFFDYLSGAHRGNGWKQTPRLDSLFIEYVNPLRMMRREVTVK
jgi:hypothetical protein